MKSILDPTFRYVPAIETDIRKTFARVRGEVDAEEQLARDIEEYEAWLQSALPAGPEFDEDDPRIDR